MKTGFNCLSDLVERDMLHGKRVFIRSDLNVPQAEDGSISDDTRIVASLPAIQQALDAGAAVMVTSHLGRPNEGEFDPRYSLAPIADRMAELLGRPVKLIRDWVDGVQVQPGQVVLLENCRMNRGEKENSDALGRKIAALCDIYVNDAFATAHRAEATTHAVAKFVPLVCAGPLLSSELAALEKALDNPAAPIVAIVGGSKVSTKLTILQSLANKVDHLIVGGGIANTFMLAAGLNIGKSLAEPGLVKQAADIMELMAKRGASVPIPVDVVCAKEFASDSKPVVKAANSVADDEMILDIGPQTAERLAAQIMKARTIVWNGPVGVFEFKAFSFGTRIIAQAVAASKGFSIAGGGDTVAAIAKFNIAHQVDYVSTGGGAFLEFLEGRALPAVQVLTERSRQFIY